LSFVTLTTSQTVSGDKTFTGVSTFSNVSRFTGTQIGIGTTSITSGFLMDVSGNVKIKGNLDLSGNTIIRGPFDVSENAIANIFLNNSNTRRGFISLSGDGISIGNTLGTNTVPIRFMPNNTEVARITPVGRLGIGTSNPNASLDVSGDAIIRGPFDVTGATTLGGNLFVSSGNVGIGTTVDSDYKLKVDGSLNITGNTKIEKNVGIDGGATINATLKTNSGNVTLCTTSGNVGIGTTTPQATLDVNGSNGVKIHNEDLNTWIVRTRNLTSVFDTVQLPDASLHIHEASRTTSGSYNGTLVLTHGNSGGHSSIIFPSNYNYGSDYGYIMYQDDINNSQTSEKTALVIGVENDDSDINADIIKFRLNNNDCLTINQKGGLIINSNYLEKSSSVGVIDALLDSWGAGDYNSYWSSATTRGSDQNYDINWSIKANGVILARLGFLLLSDDRYKEDEIIIKNITDSLMKLRPQIYKRYETFSTIRDVSDSYIIEPGLIAQEIFYDCPQLRHLVTLPEDVSFNLLNESIKNNIHSSIDPQQDPDYESLGWGTTPAHVNYIGFIPYLIRGFQEQQELIESQKTLIESQQSQINEQKDTINTQHQTISTLQTELNSLKEMMMTMQQTLTNIQSQIQSQT
jgi:hypothetical protein